MKKLIAVLIVITMLFSLCACGVKVYEGSKFSVQLKNDGSRHVTVIISTPNISSYTRDYIIPQDENGQPMLQVDTAKVTDLDVVYKLRAEMPGATMFSVNFSEGGEEAFATLNFALDISEKKKITVSDVFLDDAPKSEALEGVDGSVTLTQGDPSQVISLSGETGSWRRGGYDASVIEVAMPDLTEDNYYEFLVTAVGEGQSSAQFFCRETMQQIVFHFVVTPLEATITPTEVASEGGSAESAAQEPETVFSRYVLTMLNYEMKPFTREEDPAWQEKQKDSWDAIPEEFNNAFLPADMEFEDLGFRLTGDLVLDTVVNFNEDLLDYYVGTEFSAEDEIKQLEAEDEPIKTRDELTIADKTVIYLVLENGSTFALWEDEEFCYRLTFLQDQDDAANRETLEKFLEAKSR